VKVRIDAQDIEIPHLSLAIWQSLTPVYLARGQLEGLEVVSRALTGEAVGSGRGLAFGLGT